MFLPPIITPAPLCSTSNAFFVLFSTPFISFHYKPPAFSSEITCFTVALPPWARGGGSFSLEYTSKQRLGNILCCTLLLYQYLRVYLVHTYNTMICIVKVIANGHGLLEESEGPLTYYLVLAYLEVSMISSAPTLMSLLFRSLQYQIHPTPGRVH